MLGYFILGVALLLGLIIGGQALTKVNPKTILKILRIAALLILGSFAIYFGMTGRFQIAAGFAFACLFFIRNRGLFASTSPSSGSQSDVKTDWLHAMLDHDTGNMDAEILQGAFEGKKLSDLSLHELETLKSELTIDKQSLSIVETFINRNFEEEDAGDDGQTNRSHAKANGVMSREEAYEILELDPGASLADIKSAHRRLMKKFHPDHNGSAYMAAKINQAKDTLINS